VRSTPTLLRLAGRSASSRPVELAPINGTMDSVRQRSAR
jgi:hypothetical protein